MISTVKNVERGNRGYLREEENKSCFVTLILLKKSKTKSLVKKFFNPEKRT